MWRREATGREKVKAKKADQSKPSTRGTRVSKSKKPPTKKKEARLSDLLSAGLPTIAIRVPNHPVAKALLEKFGGAVAAPSANPSGQISPTSAAHVQSGLEGRIDAIVDGGLCTVGLESTIIRLDDTAVLLRPGGVAAEDIENEIDSIIERGIIKAIGDRNSNMTVADVAEDTGFIDASGAEIPEEYVYTDHGPNYEINEKNNVANGGKREKGQVDLATSIHNKQKYNIEQKNK